MNNDLNWLELTKRGHKEYTLVCNPADKAICEEATKRAKCDEMTDIVTNEYQERGMFVWIDNGKAFSYKLPIEPDIKPRHFFDMIANAYMDREPQKIYIYSGGRSGGKTYWLDKFFKGTTESEEE